jgi:Tol biopolymer transport system component
MPFFSQSTFAHNELSIVNLDADPNPTRRILSPDSRVSGAVVFTPDEKGVAYPILENGVSNIWVQPLDGSPGRQITNFKSGTFGSFRWSPDGKLLALIRDVSQSDVVLLHEVSQAASLSGRGDTSRQVAFFLLGCWVGAGYNPAAPKSHLC